MVNLRRLLNSLLELLRNALNLEESPVEAWTGSGVLGELSQSNAVSLPADEDGCMVWLGGLRKDR